MKHIGNINSVHEGVDVQAALDAGYALGSAATTSEIRRVDEGAGNKGTPFLVSKEPVTLTSLEQLGERPTRVRGVVDAETPLGFADYVKRYRTDDTIVFIRRSDADMTAVFDYHSASREPNAGLHRAVFTAVTTPEWDRWIAKNGSWLSQLDFAEFIEDNLDDIGTPDGGVLLDLVENFKVKKDVHYTSEIRRQSGAVRLTFNEDVTGTGGSATGALAIPEKIVLGIAVYEGGQKFRVEARFRYRLSGGKLALSFDILRLDDVLRSAFEEVVQAVRVSLGDAQVFIEGTAPDVAAIWGRGKS